MVSTTMVLETADGQSFVTYAFTPSAR